MMTMHAHQVTCTTTRQPAPPPHCPRVKGARNQCMQCRHSTRSQAGQLGPIPQSHPQLFSLIHQRCEPHRCRDPTYMRRSSCHHTHALPDGTTPGVALTCQPDDGCAHGGGATPPHPALPRLDGLAVVAAAGSRPAHAQRLGRRPLCLTSRPNGYQPRGTPHLCLRRRHCRLGGKASVPQDHLSPGVAWVDVAMETGRISPQVLRIQDARPTLPHAATVSVGPARRTSWGSRHNARQQGVGVAARAAHKAAVNGTPLINGRAGCSVQQAVPAALTSGLPCGDGRVA